MLLDKEIKISPAEWEMWKNQATTIAIFEALSEERSQWVQSLAFGETLMNHGSEAVDTARAVGTIAGLTILLEDLELALHQQWQESAERKREEEENEL